MTDVYVAFDKPILVLFVVVLAIDTFFGPVPDIFFSMVVGVVIGWGGVTAGTFLRAHMEAGALYTGKSFTDLLRERGWFRFVFGRFSPLMFVAALAALPYRTYQTGIDPDIYQFGVSFAVALYTIPVSLIFFSMLIYRLSNRNP
jgi:hypothetical protein